METIRTKHLRRKINTNLVESRNGRSFDGVLQQAHINGYNVGIVYGATPLFEDGQFIQLAEIVNAGSIGGEYYVETRDQLRFLISDTELKPMAEEFNELFKELEINRDYLAPMQWSNKP